MCSKYTSLRSSEKKKLKDSNEDLNANSKKFKEGSSTYGGKTLAQKRLEKIRQAAKGVAKSEEACQTTKKGKSTVYSNKAVLNSEETSQIIRKGKLVEPTHKAPQQLRPLGSRSCLRVVPDFGQCSPDHQLNKQYFPSPDIELKRLPDQRKLSSSISDETSSKQPPSSNSGGRKQEGQDQFNLKAGQQFHEGRSSAQSRFDRYKRERKKDCIKESLKPKKKNEETVFKKATVISYGRSHVFKQPGTTKTDVIEQEKLPTNSKAQGISNVQNKIRHNPIQLPPNTKSSDHKYQSPNNKDKVSKNIVKNLYKRKSGTATEMDSGNEKKYKGAVQFSESLVPVKTSSPVLRRNLEKEIVRLEPNKTVVGSKLNFSPITVTPGYLNNSKGLNDSNSFVEDMEWEVTSEDVTLQLHTARQTVNNNDYIETMDWQESPLVINKTPDSNIVYYVVDTNIFISSLRLIKKIKDHFAEGFQNIIVIPWQVLKELDCLKNSSTSHVSKAARKSVEYLLHCMAEQSSNVVWQTQQQAKQECPDFYVEIPDDHIIKCCFQLNTNGHNVVLISNDKNLRLKASVHKIATISDEKLLEKFALQTSRKPDKLPLEEQPVGTKELEIYAHKLTERFKQFLNNVTQKYLVNVYGSMWIWYIPEKPPISLYTLLDLFKNIGSKIFVTGEFKKYLDPVTSFLTTRNYSQLTVSELDKIARLCLKFAKLLQLEKEFFLDAMEFEDNLAFLKSREPASQIPFIELCCKLTIQHFQIFEAIIIGYCYKVAEVLGINFAESTLSDRPYIEPHNFDIKSISEYIEIVRVMSVNLERIGRTPTDRINVQTRGIVTIYNSLISYIKEADFFFTVQDVVEFFKNNSIRSGLPEALEVFDSVLQYLVTTRKIAITRNIL